MKMRFFYVFLLIFISILANVSSQLVIPPLPVKCIRPHEVYECGSPCQTQCKTLGEPCPIINKKCTYACRCDKGYARDDNGKCIPIKQCNRRN
ncbi:unnamed protein product [Psylliodes chrysocephalus]|uniref:TIL domain-containing protein n=1 Tax=Psylliodes chrysocephalus TaxID=3402493 RepID=A0A9P0GGC8_9CUCU|nr:unnamed protein product [Psylliodes chrysocephala]